MFNINFNYDVKKIRLYWYKKTLVALANYTYRKLNLSNEIYLDCSFVGIDEICSINKKYRKKDKPTDVISFALNDGQNFNTSLLGDIYICYEKILEQSKSYKHSFKRELCFLFLHGLLHLLGYDHINEKDEKIMFNLQDEILTEMGITR